jgi:DNA-directed RNA polymerase subunit beta
MCSRAVHVDEFSLEVRETKRGVEELTSDIPNISEEATKNWMKTVLFV